MEAANRSSSFRIGQARNIFHDWGELAPHTGRHRRFSEDPPERCSRTVAGVLLRRGVDEVGRVRNRSQRDLP